MRVDPDIVAARGLPLDFYRSAEHFERQRRQLLARTWHFLSAADELGGSPGSVSPHSLLPGSLDEPVVLVRGDDGSARCLSNVCSHRAAQVVSEPGVHTQLRCPYHGRCFDLHGRLRSAPGFESPSGDLEELPLHHLGPFLFAAIEATQPFPALSQRLAELPWSDLRLDRGACSNWEVQAHWALYVENYLEGLHIPFVHRALAGTLDWSRYRYEQFPGGTLQVGIAADGEPAFSGEEQVAAWYLWLFPTTMLNIYPWGVSLNRVLPLGPSRTGIEFQTWVWRPDLRGAGAGSGLDHVEREDEAIVESVQRGVRSTLARRAEYSPQHEQGVHHFHRMLAEFLDEPG